MSAGSERKDAPLFFVERGKGTPLVFIPGIGATWRMYAPQLESFSGDYRVIVPDLRGTGDSPVLDGPAKTVLERQAADVVELLDTLGVDKAHVVGISYGGIIVQLLAMNWPNRWLSLTLCDTFADTTPHDLMDRLTLLGARQTSVLAWNAAVRKRLFGPSIRWQYRTWPAAREAMLAVIANPRGEELALQREAINDIHYLRGLQNVHVPALCLAGESSKILMKRVREIASALPDSRYQTIPRSFDPSNLCNTKAFDKALRDFLHTIA